MVNALKKPSLAVHNRNVEQEPYVQLFLEYGKKIPSDHYIARAQVARECYRRRVSFMKFMRDCPAQMDMWKISSNVFLKWLEQQGV